MWMKATALKKKRNNVVFPCHFVLGVNLRYQQNSFVLFTYSFGFGHNYYFSFILVEFSGCWVDWRSVLGNPPGRGLLSTDAATHREQEPDVRGNNLSTNIELITRFKLLKDSLRLQFQLLKDNHLNFNLDYLIWPWF